MPVKINGATSGSVTLAAPNTGSDVTLTLPTLGFGKVLQVVLGETTSTITVNSTSFTDTGLSATITPSSTSSRVLVVVSQAVQVERTLNSQGLSVQLLRGSSVIYTPDGTGGTGVFLDVNGATYINSTSRQTYIHLDSPASTSALTYKTQGRPFTTANTGRVYFQNGTSSTMLLVEIGP